MFFASSPTGRGQGEGSGSSAHTLIRSRLQPRVKRSATRGPFPCAHRAPPALRIPNISKSFSSPPRCPLPDPFGLFPSVLSVCSRGDSLHPAHKRAPAALHTEGTRVPARPLIAVHTGSDERSRRATRVTPLRGNRRCQRTGVPATKRRTPTHGRPATLYLNTDSHITKHAPQPASYEATADARTSTPPAMSPAPAARR